MALLKIARMGHPVLAKPAAEVPDPTDPALARLVADMRETLLDAGGVGLAAPQVHVPLRVMVFFVPGGRLASGEGGRPASGEETAPEVNPDGTPVAGPVPLTVLLNPQIWPLGDEVAVQAEGCLSLPGMSGPVPRPARIRYVGLGLDGQRIERLASGFHARVVQHEFDHLDGILYPQRMADLSGFGFVEELKKR